MCGLCGVFLAETHWTETSIRTGADHTAGSETRTRLRERQHRVALANRILKPRGLKLSDWSGSAYLVSNQTGQTAVVQSIGAVWQEAERLGKQPIDPLDERLIDSLRQA